MVKHIKAVLSAIWTGIRWIAGAPFLAVGGAVTGLSLLIGRGAIVTREWGNKSNWTKPLAWLAQAVEFVTGVTLAVGLGTGAIGAALAFRGAVAFIKDVWARMKADKSEISVVDGLLAQAGI